MAQEGEKQIKKKERKDSPAPHTHDRIEMTETPKQVGIAGLSVGDLPGDRQNRDNQGISPMQSLLGSKVKGEGPCELLLLASIRPVELITLKETEKDWGQVPQSRLAVSQILSQKRRRQPLSSSALTQQKIEYMRVHKEP